MAFFHPESDRVSSRLAAHQSNLHSGQKNQTKEHFVVSSPGHPTHTTVVVVTTDSLVPIATSTASSSGGWRAAPCERR